MDLARIGAAAQPLEKVPGVPGGFLNGAIAEPRKAGGGRRMCSKSQKKTSENIFDWEGKVF